MAAAIIVLILFGVIVFGLFYAGLTKCSRTSSTNSRETEVAGTFEILNPKTV